MDENLPAFRVPTGPARRTQQPQPSGGEGSSHVNATSNTNTNASASSFSTTTTTTTTATATTRVYVTSVSQQTNTTTAENLYASESSSGHGQGIARYSKPTASQIPQFDLTQQQTQLLENSQVLSEDMESENIATVIAILQGYDGTMHATLYDDKDSVVFGSGNDFDVQICSSFWPPHLQKKDAWFSISWKLKSGIDNHVTFTIRCLNSVGVQVGKKLLSKGQSKELNWGANISASFGEQCLFKYVFRSPMEKESSEVKTERAVYVLEKEVGSGMYARVFKARNTRFTDAVYACKVIDTTRREFTPVELENIKYEIELLKSLSHVNSEVPGYRNIVKFVDETKIQQKIYIFLEFIDGQTLHHYYAEKNDFVEEADARDIMRQVCDAVNYLHARNIVHRDIKSENVMIATDADGSRIVKLIDFGLARATTSESMLSTFCGTPFYMAPECAENGDEVNAYGKPVDVWALGVLLFRVLTGMYPFCDPAHHKNETNMSKTTPMTTRIDIAEVKAEDGMAGIEINVGGNSEETNMVGVERKRGENAHQDRKPPMYMRDWRPFVDRIQPRSNEVKRLLEMMLVLDPSRRLPISHVLRSDWMCMSESELKKLDETGSESQLAQVTGGSTSENKLWGILEKVPGSIGEAPRRIALVSDQTWFGRDERRVGVPVNDPSISSVHCVIRRMPYGITVGDCSQNGTFINSAKIGMNQSLQILHNDELALLLPPDPNPELLLRNWNNRFLKYKFMLMDPPPVTEEQMVKRRFVSDPTLKPVRPNTRKLPVLNIPQSEDWPDADHVWATLEPINGNSAVEKLVKGTVVIGRLPDCDIILPHNVISRYHCQFDYDINGQASYVSSLGRNIIKINNQPLTNKKQLRDGDVIHLFAPAAYEENDWIGYTYRSHLEMELPNPKRIKE